MRQCCKILILIKYRIDCNLAYQTALPRLLVTYIEYQNLSIFVLIHLGKGFICDIFLAHLHHNLHTVVHIALSNVLLSRLVLNPWSFSIKYILRFAWFWSLCWIWMRPKRSATRRCISFLVIVPSLFTSNTRKILPSTSWGVPSDRENNVIHHHSHKSNVLPERMWKRTINSMKSIKPSPLVS